MDNVTFRHRNALKHHWTQTSNALIFGYRTLSDGAKLTYQAVDSFDWPSSGGKRKGYAHPSLGRIASLLGVAERTVRRHLAELEAVGLLIRELRPGTTSLLYIEDPSADHVAQYLAAINPDPEDGEPDGRDGDDDYQGTPDRIVRPLRTRLSAPSIEEHDREENKRNVERTLVGLRREEGSDGTHIGITIQRRRMELQAGRVASGDHRAEVLADELVRELGDGKSRSFYLGLARTVPAAVLYEAMGQVKETWREGRIRTSPGALFNHRIQQWRMRQGPANVRPVR